MKQVLIRPFEQISSARVYNVATIRHSYAAAAAAAHPAVQEINTEIMLLFANRMMHSYTALRCLSTKRCCMPFTVSVNFLLS
jgi:D-aminopeptidase